MTEVTEYYLMGIREGRQHLEHEPNASPLEMLENLNSTIKRGFAANSPVGQMLRGERDFWLNQMKRKG